VDVVRNPAARTMHLSNITLQFSNNQQIMQMKFIALSVLFIIAAVLQGTYIEGNCIDGGIAAIGEHSYIVGLRETKTGSNSCSESLTPPSSILITAHCIGGLIKYASIGLRYLNGSSNREHI